MKAIAVFITDVHYDLSTKKIADIAVRTAIKKANELGVFFINAGDLHNSKANMRGECVNAIIETFKTCQYVSYSLVGNHSRLNEKSPEHALNFLAPYTNIITDYTFIGALQTWLVPYHSESELPRLKEFLKALPKGTQVAMHQGLTKSNSGEYFMDKSALAPEDVSGLRIISGHYHYRQTIELPEEGSWTFLGNPYTLSFGEANDPEKGYHILYDDGSLEFIPLNLRKHVVIEIKMGEPRTPISVNPDDIVKVKITGTMEQLSPITKKTTASELNITQPFRLELIPITSSAVLEPKSESQSSILDSLIDLASSSEEAKTRIKTLWRSFTQ